MGMKSTERGVSLSELSLEGASVDSISSMTECHLEELLAGSLLQLMLCPLAMSQMSNTDFASPESIFCFAFTLGLLVGFIALLA